MFACAEDQLGHAVLFGYHDGLDSWTVNVSADPSGQRQEFVSRHEAAHHNLHSTTAWGVAMLAAGTPNSAGEVSSAAWQQLGRACRAAHEAFATYAAVQQTTDGLDRLVGNLAYLAHLRDAETLADLAAVEEHRSVVVELLIRCMMAPSPLAALACGQLRDAATVAELCDRHSPDGRLARLLETVGADPGARRTVAAALTPDRGGMISTQTLAMALDSIDIRTLDFGAAATWTRQLVDELHTEGARDYLLVDAATGTGRLESVVDDQQRERLQVHAEPLALRVVTPAEGGAFPVTEFARTAPDVGPHVWMCWLGSGFLRRQFTVADDIQDTPWVGLLACNRVRTPVGASWLPFPGVSPAAAARLVGSTAVTPLLFTTLRTLDLTPPDVDFTGWDRAVVLIDSDVLAFLHRSAESEGGMVWAVVGATGDRTVDVLVFERAAAPGVVYLYVCSAPTGKTVAAWLRTQPDSFRHDDAAFTTVRPLVWAVLEHLLGTLWIFDLHGWGA